MLDRRLLSPALALALLSSVVPIGSALSAGSAAHTSPQHKPVIKSPHLSIPGKPALREEWYKGCPPWGRGGDAQESLLKNRIDRAAHTESVTIGHMLSFHWPGIISQQSIPMAYWTKPVRAAVFRYEGSPVRLTGYLTSFDTSGPPESTNCGGSAGSDWHLWIGTKPGSSRKQSAVAEATPRVRAREAGFSAGTLKTIARHHDLVRVTGWLFLDIDHPINDTDRATLWEVHPITQLDRWQQKTCTTHRHHRRCVAGHWVKVAG